MVGPERLYLAHALHLTEAQVHRQKRSLNELPQDTNFILPFVMTDVKKKIKISVVINHIGL
jgi:hypothetical protein